MVLGQVLNGEYRAVSHIPYATCGRIRLLLDEFLQAAKLQAKGGSRSIIDQDEKLQPCPVSLQRHPASHRILLVALKHLHIGWSHRWDPPPGLGRFYKHHH